MEQKLRLYFSIGPVQQFIETARTVRDLWTGSYLLSWLTASAMAEVLELGGKLQSQAMEKNPLVKLHRNGSAGAGVENRLASCLPNTFMAKLPDNVSAEDARSRVELAVRDAWKKITRDVKDKLVEKWEKSEQGSFFGWDDQVEGLWDIHVGSLDADMQIQEASRALGISEEHEEKARAALLGKLAAAEKTIRHYPPHAPPGDTRPKCSLTGVEECMGPGSKEFDAFWSRVRREPIEGSQVGKQERLGAIGLVKRFAWPLSISTRLGLKPKTKRMWDTATIAAAGWLAQAQQLDIAPGGGHDPLHEWSDKDNDGWSGQWLHWPTPQPPGKQDDEKECPVEVHRAIKELRHRDRLGSAPAYYAILMLDGDRMGELFRRAKPDEGNAISDYLQIFALESVPETISEYLGTLDLKQPVYAGGDDVLAMLPLWMPDGNGIKTVLHCAQSIDAKFKDKLSGLIKEKVTPSTSAGIAIVHYKEDLREALNAARAAEKAAKAKGRNRLAITAMRRSGETTTAILEWERVKTLAELVKEFKADGLTDRWTYQLRRQWEALGTPDDDHGLDFDPDMFDAEVARLLARSEKRERMTFERWQELALCDQDGTVKRKQSLENRWNALKLIQTASFMARGKDG